MGRPVNPKFFGNVNTNSIIVSTWTNGDTGANVGFIVKQRSDDRFVTSTSMNTPTSCNLVNGVANITAPGMASIKVFPYGADGAVITPASLTVASVKLVGAKIGQDAFGAPTAGSGYSVNDVLTVVGGTFSTSAQITVNSVSATGGINTFTVSRAGSYSVVPNPDVDAPVTGGTGLGAEFTLSLGINAITIGTAGAGYSNVRVAFGPTGEFGVDATATATTGNLGNIASVTINSAGSGYLTVPTVAVIDTALGAHEHVARLSSKRVHTIEGNVYRWYPAGYPIVSGQANLDTK